jgi:hypothetical protein
MLLRIKVESLINVGRGHTKAVHTFGDDGSADDESVIDFNFLITSILDRNKYF